MSNYIEGLISVIVPVYNTEKYIAECLDSIINQTYKKLEIIVIEDGSIDNSYDVCKEYAKKDDRIILIQQENSGVAMARSNGIDHANGEFVVFVDSDDYIENTMYEDMMNEKGDADLVSCTFIRHVSEEKENDAVVYRKNLFDEITYCDEKFFDKMIYDFDEEKILRLSPNIWNKLFIHDKVDKFYKNLNNDIYNGEDFLFVCNYVLMCKKIVFLDKPLYNYRFRNDSCVRTIRDNELHNVNNLYLAIRDILRDHFMEKSLTKQLQKYIQMYVGLALNKFMGFDENIRIPKYIIDTNGLKNKKIAIYGFGEIGQDTFWQLNKFEYDIVLKVDKNYSYYQSKGMDVYSIEKLLEIDYDVILITVKDENSRKEIKDNLIKLGINEKKFFEYKLSEIF